MAAFASGEITLSASTATKIVDAEDFGRSVLVYGDAVRVAFTSGSVSAGARISGSSLGEATLLVLPADEELWAYHTSAVAVGYLVTSHE